MFGRQSVKINTVLTVDSFRAVLSAIRNDIGLGIITDQVIQRRNRKEKKSLRSKRGKMEIVTRTGRRATCRSPWRYHTIF